MAKTWDLILQDKNDGYYNMACDEALADRYALCRAPALRIYFWSRPFITIGYRQDPRRALLPGGADFTRRITGGGAILHADEITYSLVCSPADLDLEGGVKESYRRLCRFLLDFYARLGVKARFACESAPQGLGRCSDFCFAAAEHFDLTVEGKKIGGNAQQRRRGLIFQHGSVPLRINRGLIARNIRVAPGVFARVTSLAEHAAVDDIPFLRDTLALSFARAFDVEFKACALSAAQEAGIAARAQNKYMAPDWKFKDAQTALA